MYINSKDMIHHDNAPQDTDPVADARVTDALNLLGTVEPPSELVAQVMWRTKHQSVQNHSRRPVARRNEGMHMARKVLIGLIGFAAVGLLVASISGGIPATTWTEGTIGAAQRYNAEQIKTSDVTIENAALASFMQTDIFEKLSRDKMAVAALASALANPALAQAMLNKDFAAALASPGLQGALASPGLGQILADSTAAQLLGAQLQNAQASALGASGFAGHRE